MLKLRSSTYEQTFTLEYWIDDGWYVGKLHELPSIFSQGQTYEELASNISDTYRMVVEELNDR